MHVRNAAAGAMQARCLERVRVGAQVEPDGPVRTSGRLGESATSAVSGIVVFMRLVTDDTFGFSSASAAIFGRLELPLRRSLTVA